MRTYSPPNLHQRLYPTPIRKLTLTPQFHTSRPPSLHLRPPAPRIPTAGEQRRAEGILLPLLLPTYPSIISPLSPTNPLSKQEFTLLPPHSPIYKLVGPVLLRQERPEAILAVESRLEFIDREIKRLEGQIEHTQSESEGAKIKVYELQTRMQQEAM